MKVRLIDANKLYVRRLGGSNELSISQTQLITAPTINAIILPDKATREQVRGLLRDILYKLEEDPRSEYMSDYWEEEFVQEEVIDE